MAAKKKAAKKTAPKRKVNSIREPSSKPPKPRGGGGDKLTEEQKFFLVDQLATFVPLMTALEALKTEWPEIEITRQSAQHYDPTTYAGRVLSEALKTRFHDVRQRYREETANIAISGKAARIRKLEALAEKAEAMGNVALAREIVKQIAEEMGDVFTNKRTIDAKVAGETEVTVKPDLSEMTVEQLNVLRSLGSAMAGKPPSPR